jgi:hypothetical protein
MHVSVSFQVQSYQSSISPLEIPVVLERAGLLHDEFQNVTECLEESANAEK